MSLGDFPWEQIPDAAMEAFDERLRLVEMLLDPHIGNADKRAERRRSRAISLFRLRVGWLWNRSMRRRSQKTRLTWERMSRLIDHWLPPPRVCHPYPLHRLGVIPEAGARCGSSARRDLWRG